MQKQRRLQINKKMTMNSDEGYLVVTQPSLQETRKIIKQLEEMVREEKDKRQILEEKFYDYRNRCLNRENQFYKIVEKLNIRRSESLSNDELDGLYFKILEKFDLSNQKTNEYLENKYHQIDQLMDRRINQILNTTANELNKNFQLSKESQEAIRKEVKKTLDLAHMVEKDSYDVNEKFSQLELNNKLLLEEKKLLVEEVIYKKKQIIKLISQLKSVKAELQQIKDATTKTANKSTVALSGPEKTLRLKKESRKLAPSMCTQIELGPLELENYYVEERSKTGASTPQNRKMLTIRSFSKDSCSGRKSTAKNSHRIQSPSCRSNSCLTKKNIEEGCPKCSNQKNSDPSLYTYQKTVEHLQNMLKRQKQKFSMVSSQLSRMIMKSKEINDVLAEVLLKNKEKDPKEQLKELLESEKLLETIRDLKRKLSMIQKPTAICGWGDELVLEDL